MSYNLSPQADLSNQTARAASALRYRPPTHEDAAQTSQATEASQTTGLEWREDKLATPDLGTDVAVLTSTVSLAEADTQPQLSIFGMPLNSRNVNDILDAYKAALRGSRSGNLMEERFMQGLVANCQVFVLSLLGIKPEELTAIQTQVRDSALAEIDNRLAVDWANAKATMDILS